MIDSTGKIYNLSIGMKKSDVKTYEQKELFNIFDIDNNGEIDQNEFSTYEKKLYSEPITEIQNSHYKGAKYELEFIDNNSDNLRITNKKTNYVAIVDLNKLCSKTEDPERLKSIIRKLPLEVIVDIQNEANIAGNKNENFFLEIPNSSSFVTNDFNEVEYLTHKIGHMPHLRNALLFAAKDNEGKNIVEIFQKELREYIASPSDKIYKDYCTKTADDIIAECYTYLMLGDCPSKDLIDSHFKNTLDTVKKAIEKTHAQPPVYLRQPEPSFLTKIFNFFFGE